jgi:aminoglycoside phosphotransferase (APT) family kinase protein
MHENELLVDEAVARRLVDEQFPEWAGLPLRRVEPWGTDNAIFRLGDELAVRIPRIDGSTQPGGKVHEWLPRIAARLPMEVHLPVAQGAPSGDYPWYWDVFTWVEGETASVADIDPVQAGRDLAGLVRALQALDPAGAPAGRGVPLAERDPAVRKWLRTLGDDGRLAEEWERALAVPPWDGPPVWAHGDLDARNWLVRDGRVAAIIDWGALGVGDPAVDVMVAWKLSSAAGRAAFRDALDVDDDTWARARGWALSQGIGATAYYTVHNNRVLVLEGRRWIDDVMSDAPVALAEYDARWPERYARQERLIRDALGARALLVEHAGSTSVPGLAAKPRIDIVLAVADSSDETSYIPPLEDAGFFLRLRERDWHEHRLLRRADEAVNVHVFTAGSEEIDRMLSFRDRLRMHDDERELYERTKRGLAEIAWRTPQDYADAKSKTVEAIISRASRRTR